MILRLKPFHVQIIKGRCIQENIEREVRLVPIGATVNGWTHYQVRFNEGSAEFTFKVLIGGFIDPYVVE